MSIAMKLEFVVEGNSFVCDLLGVNRIAPSDSAFAIPLKPRARVEVDSEISLGFVQIGCRDRAIVVEPDHAFFAGDPSINSWLLYSTRFQCPIGKEGCGARCAHDLETIAQLESMGKNPGLPDCTVGVKQSVSVGHHRNLLDPLCVLGVGCAVKEVAVGIEAHGPTAPTDPRVKLLGLLQLHLRSFKTRDKRLAFLVSEARANSRPEKSELP